MSLHKYVFYYVLFKLNILFNVSKYNTNHYINITKSSIQASLMCQV